MGMGEASMTKTATVRARVDPGLKERAEGVLAKLGLNTTTAITLFYRQIVSYRGLPFDVRIPNAATRRAMAHAREGTHLVRGESIDQLLGALDTD